jgi:hypothetical protein
MEGNVMTAQELVKWIYSNLKETDKVFIVYDGQFSPLTPKHLTKTELWQNGDYYSDRDWNGNPPSGRNQIELGEQFVIDSDPNICYTEDDLNEDVKG